MFALLSLFKKHPTLLLSFIQQAKMDSSVFDPNDINQTLISLRDAFTKNKPEFNEYVTIYRAVKESKNTLTRFKVGNLVSKGLVRENQESNVLLADVMFFVYITESFVAFEKAGLIKKDEVKEGKFVWKIVNTVENNSYKSLSEHQFDILFSIISGFIHNLPKDKKEELLAL